MISCFKFDTKALDIPIIVIAPNKRTQSYSTVGSSVSIIDQETISNSNNFFLGETLDKNLPGRDNKFAILPDEFIELKEFHRKLLLSNEFKGLDYQECELDTRINYRGRFNG